MRKEHRITMHNGTNPLLRTPAVPPQANGFALSKRFLPLPVDPPIKPDGAAPLLQHHYSAFITHTGNSAPVLRLGTLTLAGLPLEWLP